MKGTTDDMSTDSGRRGLFRRPRRSEPNTSMTSTSFTSEAVSDIATVDELARRMDELASSAPHPTDETVALQLQETLEARAEQLAATLTQVEQPTTTQPGHDNETETTMSEETATVGISPDIADIELRLDAALQPMSAPHAAPVTTSLGPVADIVPTTPQTATVQTATVHALPTPPAQPTQTTEVVANGSTPDGRGAAARMGIDIDRVVQMIEDEASTVQRRIQVELRAAEQRASEVIDRAEHDAERIREHGQAQARVLLSEVEEIISEAQQTGEQILHRANEEASTLRADAASVLQQSQEEARSIIDHARSEGEQVLAEQRRLATVRAQEAMREQDRLKDQIRRLEERRRQVLESLEPLISQLSHIVPGEGTVPNVAPLQRHMYEQ